MLNALRSILDIITSIIAFVYNAFTSLLSLIQQIPQYVSMITVSVGYLPTVLIPFAIASVSLSVLLFMVNRK